jgi:hypothetical protein
VPPMGPERRTLPRPDSDREAAAGREDISRCFFGYDGKVPAAHRAHQTARRAEARGTSLGVWYALRPRRGPSVAETPGLQGSLKGRPAVAAMLWSCAQGLMLSTRDPPAGHLRAAEPGVGPVVSRQSYDSNTQRRSPASCATGPERL